jgi:hypothetical protein
MRLFVRRERPHPGAQLRVTDIWPYSQERDTPASRATESRVTGEEASVIRAMAAAAVMRPGSPMSLSASLHGVTTSRFP